MTEPLPILIENSVQIAWDYLERAGEITEPGQTSNFLLGTITGLVRQGERRKLMLSNKAISAFQQFKESQRAAA
jgi:hypothetical protein